MNLLDAVRLTCDRQGLLRGDLACAVSGGVDSVVLLHLLVELGHRPCVVTLDHGLRPESRAEVQFVLAMAAVLGLEMMQGDLAVSPGPAKAARARRARLAFFEGLPHDTICLGHHLDDQAETVLDRLARGAGSGGLGAMRARRGRLVRPLLAHRRAELVAWAEERDLRWIEDPSNREGTRGALRHTVLPALESLRPGAVRGLGRSARHLAEDDDLLTELAGGLLDDTGIPIRALRDAPPPLQRRAVLLLVRRDRGHGELSSGHIDSILRLQRGNSAVDIPGGWRVVLSASRLRCSRT
ncbi:MAG TPA: tRNA lysidine(34) synthetase TilS [Myxococcota bacterium]|nr:tRNA lysidine(34) synthetase TilS [Myxococcota bacterium]